MSDNSCSYRSSYTDSGDRGMDMSSHIRAFHPDHTHVWGDSSYEWEQAGAMHIAEGAGMVRTPRPTTAQRCTVCSITPRDDQSGKCS